MKNKIIGIIPVRSGSIRIKDKNIKRLGNKPLFSYALIAALDSDIFDEIIITTDSIKYKELIESIVNTYWVTRKNVSFICDKDYDSKVEYIIRSDELSKDAIKLEPVILDVLKKIYIKPDIVFTIQVTSPFVKADDFKNALKLFIDKKYDSLLTCYRLKRFMWSIEENITPDYKYIYTEAKSYNYDPSKRPDMKNYRGILLENGAFYISKREMLEEHKTTRLFGNIGIYEMKGKGVDIDIDTQEDWNKAKEIIDELDALKEK